MYVPGSQPAHSLHVTPLLAAVGDYVDYYCTCTWITYLFEHVYLYSTCTLLRPLPRFFDLVTPQRLEENPVVGTRM